MSITLTNIEQYLSGQAIVESNPSAAAINPQIDFVNNVISWTIQSGNISPGTFTPGSRTVPITVMVNINTGTWMAGNLNGNLAPATQNALKTLLLNMRNAMENFAVNNGIVVGITTPWTSLGV